MRVYSQNIDGLETRVGLNADLEKGKGSRGRFAKKARDTPDKDSPLTGDAGCESVPLPWATHPPPMYTMLSFRAMVHDIQFPLQIRSSTTVPILLDNLVSSDSIGETGPAPPKSALYDQISSFTGRNIHKRTPSPKSRNGI